MRTLADSQPVLTGSSGTNGGARYVSTQAADLAPGESVMCLSSSAIGIE